MFANEKVLHNLGTKYNLKISNVFQNTIIIQSKWDEWILEWNFGQWLKLKHRNTKYDKNQFHMQKHRDNEKIKFKSDELEKAFEYIKGHDKYMDERRGGERRIRVMFTKIMADNY